ARNGWRPWSMAGTRWSISIATRCWPGSPARHRPSARRSTGMAEPASAWFRHLHCTREATDERKSMPDIAVGAHVSSDVSLADDVLVGPGSVIHARVSIGAGSSVGSGSVIHAGTSLGERCLVEDGAVLGKRPRLRPGSSAAGGEL